MDIEIHLPTLHPAQAQIRHEARRFNVLDCGRRFGKDVLGHELLIDIALDGKPVAWFSPTFRMLLDTFREIEEIVKPITSRLNASDHRIELLTRGVIDMWSLDSPDVARGKKYARVIINEAAMIPRLGDIFNAIIRPTLADLQGDAFFLSTPKGRNDFYRLYIQAGESADWARWQFDTFQNPHIAKSEIEAMREQMPQRTYQQEILAQFLENQGSVFRNVRAVCTITQPDVPEAHTGHTFIAGVDWAKSVDFTRIRVGCKQCRKVVDWDGFNQIDFHFQRARLKLICDKWKVSDILAESNSIGEPNIEELQRDGLPVRGFETTATSKPPLIESLALAIEKSEWQLPAEDADELESYEMKTNASTGRPTYSAPEGGHDDRVMADALMVEATNKGIWWMT